MTRIEVRISGLGGQGVVLAGRILGHAAANEGKNVVQTQSYGSEARGSAAKSEVIISDDKIGYPLVRKCDILVAMSQRAVDVHVKDLKEHAVLLVDRDLVKTLPEISAKVYQLPTTKIAETQLRSKIYANAVMLGALTKITKIVSKKAMKNAIKSSVNVATVQKNLEAFDKGYSIC
jgi:2-oxoglutarate ferredoxin oxidoreductase subunit gamma